MVVKTTFLNGEFDEEIYMKQPDGFVAPRQENKVCRLKKFQILDPHLLGIFFLQ
jgi:hypothetical protein